MDVAELPSPLLTGATVAAGFTLVALIDSSFGSWRVAAPVGFAVGVAAEWLYRRRGH